MQKFNPLLTMAEFDQLTPEQQRQWDKDLLLFWEGKLEAKFDLADRKDGAEEHDNQMLGGIRP